MGRAKAWLPFGGEPLLAWVARLVAAEASPVVVVAAPGQDLPPLPAEIAVVRDATGDRGPLEGLLAGLEAIDADLVYAASTDAPFLAPGWIGRLAGAIGEADAAVPRLGGRRHPLAAVYRREAVLPIVRSLREEGRSRLHDLLDRAHVREVGEEELRMVDPELSSLINVNTPEDYREALRRAGLS